MINNNAKTTILITSITLSIMLLLPGNLAFAEIPADCAIGVANLGGTLIVPPDKVRPGVEVQISYIVANPDITMLDDDFDGLINEDEIDGVDNDLDGFIDEDPTNPPACDAELGPTSFFAPPNIQVDSLIISDDADCPAPFGADITLSNGDAVLLWEQTLLLYTENVTLQVI